MKTLFISLCVLFATLKLSAFVQRADILKLPSSRAVKDTIKFNYSFKYSGIFPSKDNADLTSFKHQPDHLNLSAMVKKADSVRFLDSLNISNTLYKHLKLKDSEILKISIALRKKDSLRFATYIYYRDSVKQQLKFMALDSLKQQLKLGKNEFFKGPIYSEIAARYLDYDTLSIKKQRLLQQNEVLTYSMMALHQYSRFNDTIGLRLSFDNLGKIYIAQKKYSQAKWFILQSNAISRAKRDIPNLISSLITLSVIKSEIQDYKLALKDLNEALQLSVNNHNQQKEAEVLKYFALLYSRLKDYPKEESMLKKRDSLVSSIHKAEEAKLTANAVKNDSIQKKKADLVQNKKKVYTSGIKKLSKNSLSKKTASL